MKRINKKICLFVIALLLLLLAGCYTPSPLYGTWTDNNGDKVMFMDDGSFSAKIVDSNGDFIFYEGSYTVIDNTICLNVLKPSSFTRVMEWDIRGAILYLTFENKGKTLTLYHTAR